MTDESRLIQKTLSSDHDDRIVLLLVEKYNLRSWDIGPHSLMTWRMSMAVVTPFILDFSKGIDQLQSLTISQGSVVLVAPSMITFLQETIDFTV